MVIRHISFVQCVKDMVDFHVVLFVMDLILILAHANSADYHIIDPSITNVDTVIYLYLLRNVLQTLRSTKRWHNFVGTLSLLSHQFLTLLVFAMYLLAVSRFVNTWRLTSII